ncbi:hypothetical protein M885DRAFT_510212 [Pelagophyceae sp. CCMP2097]|nr:hypothetical protein M885DRAFT_510212 [Pelagophyceae sp. CCMP2097]
MEPRAPQSLPYATRVDLPACSKISDAGSQGSADCCALFPLPRCAPRFNCRADGPFQHPHPEPFRLLRRRLRRRQCPVTMPKCHVPLRLPCQCLRTMPTFRSESRADVCSNALLLFRQPRQLERRLRRGGKDEASLREYLAYTEFHGRMLRIYHPTS